MDIRATEENKILNKRITKISQMKNKWKNDEMKQKSKTACYGFCISET